MNNLKKLIGIIPKILFALMLSLALLNVTSCDNMLDFGKGSQGDSQGTGSGPGQGTTQGNNGGNGNNGQDNQQGEYKNHYSEYANFNPADYPIINESGKSDSKLSEAKDFIWLMYAEKENVGDWTANYVKTNKIKTILNDTGYYIHPSELDRLYVSIDDLWMSHHNNIIVDDNRRVEFRDEEFRNFTHETMHLVQYSGARYLMTGMRPDIYATFDLLHEFFPYFYANGRDAEADVTTDMKNAVETQSKIMVLATNLLAHDDDYLAYLDNAFAKDPSLPKRLFRSNWPLSFYARSAITSIGPSLTPPLIKASKEDMLKVARALLDCRDPKQAGVTDEALWYTFDTLHKAVTRENNYLLFNDDPKFYGYVKTEEYNRFLYWCDYWDTEFAKQ